MLKFFADRRINRPGPAMSILSSGSTAVRTNSAREASRATWQQTLKHAVRDPLELCRLLALPELEPQALRAAESFPFLRAKLA